MMDPLPSKRTIFAVILSKERHYNVSGAQATKIDIVEFSAKVGARNNGFCSHCAKSGHDNKSFFKLKCFLEWWYSGNCEATARGRGGRRASR